jgi:flagellar motor switch protein FliN
MANVDTTRVAAPINEAAEAAATNLAPGIASGFVGEGTEPVEFVPSDGAVAVTARMSGLEGIMVLALTPELVAEILAGPTGAQGLVFAAEQGLRAAAAVLDQAAPRALRLDDIQEVVALPIFEAARDAWWFGAAPLFRGEDHVGSLALFLTEPAVTDSDEDVEIIELEDSDGAELFTPPLASESGRGAFDPFAGADGNPAAHSLRMLRDVEMEVTVELGRTKMSVRNILSLTTGSVIELDRAAGAPVDLLVNGTLIGRGEVVVIDEEFGVRISEIIGRTESD